jgi:FtsZ-binding cell division protein ZapB
LANNNQSLIQSAATPQQYEGIINNLQRQLQFRGAEIRILRNIVEGAISLADDEDEMELELAEGMGSDIGMLRAWNIQLRIRIKELEDAARIPRSPTKASRSPTRERSAPPSRETESLIVTPQTSLTPKSPSELTELERKVKEQELTISSLSETNAKLRLEVTELKTKAKSSTDMATSPASTSPTKISDADTEKLMESLRKQCETLKLDKETSALNHNKTISELSSQLESAAKKIMAVQARNAEMENEIERLAEERDYLERGVKTKDQAQVIEQMQTKIEMLSRHLEMSAQDNKMLLEENKNLKSKGQGSVGGGKSEVSVLSTREIAESNHRISQLEADKANLQKDLDTLKALVANSETSWKSERASLLKDIAALRESPPTQTPTLETNVKVLSMELEEMSRRCEKLSKDYDAIVAERVKLLKESDVFKLDKIELQERVKSLESKLQNLEQAAADKDIQLQLQRETVAAASNSNADELLKIRAERDTFKAQLASAEGKVLELHQSVSSLKSDIASQTKTSISSKDHMKLQAQNEQLQSELALTKTEAVDLVQTVTKLEAELEAIKAAETAVLNQQRAAALQDHDSMIPKELLEASDEQVRQTMGALESVKRELSATKTALETAQELTKSKTEAMQKLEQELQTLRLAQADIGSVLLLKGRDAASSDMIHILQRRNEELAAQIMDKQTQIDNLNQSLETQKKRALEGAEAVQQLDELKGEVRGLKDQLRREKDTSSVKARNLYRETERVQLQHHSLLKDVEAIKKCIWDSRNEYVSSAWVQEMLHLFRAGGRMEDVEVLQWVKWMIAFTVKQQKDLEEAHMILDVQHEKLEDAMVRASMSIDVSRPMATPSNLGSLSELRSPLALLQSQRATQDWVGGVEVGTQTDAMLSFARMSTIKASAAAASSRSPSLRGSNSVRRSRSSSIASSVASMPDLGGGGHFEVEQQQHHQHQHQHHQTEGLAKIDEQPNSIHNSSMEAEAGPSPAESKLQAALSALMGRYVSLQQTTSTLQSQLDHQLRTNSEIKKLIVGASLSGIGPSPSRSGSGLFGGGGNSGAGSGKASSNGAPDNLLEKYNDALVEIGALRTEVDRWRMRCEEVEEVVENIVLKASGQSEEEEDEGEREEAGGHVGDASEMVQT